MEKIQQPSFQRYFNHLPTLSVQSLKQQIKNIEQSIAQKAYLFMQEQSHKLTLTMKEQDQQKQQIVRSRIINIQKQSQQLKRQLKQLKSQQKTKRERKTQPPKLSKPKTNHQLKKLTQLYKQFIQDVQLKSKFIKISQEEYKERQIMQHKQKLVKRQAQQREQAKQNLFKIQQRKSHRQMQKQQQQSYFKNISKKRLYHKMIENYHQHINSIQSQKKQCFINHKMQNSVNIQSLGSHEQQYKKLLVQKQKKREQLKDSSRINLPSLSPYKSKFYHNIIKQDQSKFEDSLNKYLKAKQKKQIYKNYQQKVLRDHAPKTKPLQENHYRLTKARQALNKQQIREIGNKYYSLGQSRIQRTPKKIPEKQNSQDKQAIKKNYPDYLPLVLKQNNIDISKINRKAQCKRQVNKILKENNLSQSQKLQKIQYYFNQAYPIDKYSKHSQIIKKLQAKLQLLNVIK